jgi:hypothetical protein
MKSVLFCLIAVTVSAPTAPHLTRVSSLKGDVAMGTASPSTFNCMPSTEIVGVPNDQREVHAVVVDMPQRESLEYASPESWGTLPTFDPPNEESPTKPLQVALN